MYRTWVTHSLRVFLAAALMLAAGAGSAMLFGLYGGLDGLERNSDATVVIEVLGVLLSDAMFGAAYFSCEVRILKSLRGPLEEQTTMTANLAQLPIYFTNNSGATA